MFNLETCTPIIQKHDGGEAPKGELVRKAISSEEGALRSLQQGLQQLMDKFLRVLLTLAVLLNT